MCLPQKQQRDSEGRMPLQNIFPKIALPPKWMVYNVENPIKMDDVGGKPHYFRKHSYSNPYGD